MQFSTGEAMSVRKVMGVVLVCIAFVNVANAQDHWVTSWTAAPQQPRGGGPPPAAAAAAPGGGQRGQAGPAVAAAAPVLFNDQTVRMIVRTTLSGRRARVTLSNAFGNAPLKIGEAHVALRSKESEIVAGSDRTLMFNGKPGVSIGQGAQMVSDPVDINIPQFGDVVVSIYVPGET